MPRRKKITKRPSYRAAVAWIAHEDNPGGSDSLDWISGYLTTHLVADLFGIADTRDVAWDVARERERAGLGVGADE